MDYEKINKAIMEILEEKYNIKIEAKVERLSLIHIYHLHLLLSLYNGYLVKSYLCCWHLIHFYLIYLI